MSDKPKNFTIPEEEIPPLLATFHQTQVDLRYTRDLWMLGARYEAAAASLMVALNVMRNLNNIPDHLLEPVTFSMMVMDDLAKGRLPLGWRAKPGGVGDRSHSLCAKAQIAAVADLAMSRGRERLEAGRFAALHVDHRAFGFEASPSANQILRWRDRFRNTEGLGRKMFEMVIRTVGPRPSDEQMMVLLKHSMLFPSGPPYEAESDQ